jgi:carbonic anhydrase
MSISGTPPTGNFDGTDTQFSQGARDTLQKVLDANRAYAGNFGDNASLVGAPRRRMAILTCMDARMDPAKFLGRASEDAIRSLVVSCKLMGTTDWFVIHHSGCGMQSYSDEDIRHLLKTEDHDTHHEGTKWWQIWKSAQTRADIQWLTFSDLRQSIIEDVGRIRSHPYVPASVAIYGYIYHIHHGTLEAVPEANRIGAPGTEPI